MFCTECGKEIGDDSKFCRYCGTKVRTLKDSADPEDAALVAESEAEAADATTAEAPDSAPADAEKNEAADSKIAATRRALTEQPGASGTPLQPVAATEGGPAARQALGRNKLIAIIAAAAVVVIAGVFVIFNSAAPGQSSPTVEANPGDAPTITVKNIKVSAIKRPSLLGTQVAYADDGSSVTAAISPYMVDDALSNVLYVNEMLGNSTPVQQQARQLLAQNGFVVVEGTGDEFYEQYERNRYAVLPSFVTTDSMMHTYHLYFSHLMKNTERTYLAPALAEIGKSMMQASEKQLEQLAGTEWENAAKRNLAFFAVGAALMDPSVQVPSSVSKVVSDELALIQAAGGMATSPLFGAAVDYSQYIVRGYYAGDAALEPYFRAMMWYGQSNFAQRDEDLDRSALLMTLALNDGAFNSWESVYAITSFFAGASDDCGYYEYFPLFAAAYGDNATVANLAGNEAAWKTYHELTAAMPAPKINSVVVQDEGTNADHNEQEKGYRFMGQRFSIDASILQQLVYNRVGGNSKGANRMLPNALDVPAALGSDEALAILKEKGETSYEGYEANMSKLRDDLSKADGELWNASLYSRWLYTLNPLLEKKGEGWPQFMQSGAWLRKNLQTYLGSYTELKHDTVLYSKQVMAELGGGGFKRTDDRGYVEPEPVLYARLATLVNATSEGLAGFNMLSEEDAANLALLRDLASQLETISKKELKQEPLTDQEYELIRSYGGQLEHFWTEVYKNEPTENYKLSPKDYPAAVVTDIATDPNGSVLELGTGRPAEICAIVPVDGGLRLAQGTVFSFYQFSWPLNDRLTDKSWREMMGFVHSGGSNRSTGSSSITTEDWARDFFVSLPQR